MPRATPLLLALAALLCASAIGAATASAETVWLCKPGMADNPCEIGMDTTVREPGGAERVETPPVPDDRPIDCFYVYPTVSNQLSQNADKSRDPELLSIAKYQAARFSLRCRVFAPVYRQSTLFGLTTGNTGLTDRQESFPVAYGDVREAWREYLAQDNGGRGVVLIGHSQGTRMLRELITKEIDPDPAARRRMISGLLLGGDVLVRKGELAGGDFEHVPLCTEPGQLSCVVAFSTFARDPQSNARFGDSEDPRLEAACTDPRPLARTGDPLRILTPSEPYAPGPIQAGIIITSGGMPPSAPTTWVVPADRYEGTCRTINGVNVLRYEPTEGSRRPVFFPDPTWGTHLIDVNLALDPLLEVVRLQSERYREPDLRLTRRCAGGGALGVELRGDDELVRDVSFKFGKRLVSRDTAGAFARTISARTLASTSARRLRAVVYLKGGGPARVVLARSLPRCGT